MLAEDTSLPSSPDGVLPGLLPVPTLSGPVGKSSKPVPILPYYMEVKPGHLLRQTYRGFTRWICGVRDDDKVTVDTPCAMLGVHSTH